MKDASNRRAVALRDGGSDPLEHPVERVRVGEDVVRRLPVAVLVGVAEARDPERRAVSERAAKVRRSGAAANRRPDRVDDRGWIAE